jgi:hypothetical protein
MTSRPYLRVSKPQQGKGRADSITDVFGLLFIELFLQLQNHDATTRKPACYGSATSLAIIARNSPWKIRILELSGRSHTTRSDWLGPLPEPQNFDVIVPSLGYSSFSITETCMNPLNQTISTTYQLTYPPHAHAHEQSNRAGWHWRLKVIWRASYSCGRGVYPG